MRRRLNKAAVSGTWMLGREQQGLRHTILKPRYSFESPSAADSPNLFFMAVVFKINWALKAVGKCKAKIYSRKIASFVI
jgi:hypothetical protein